MVRAVIVCCLAVATPAPAETIQFGAARDTMIFQNNVAHGAGGAPGFLAGTNSQPSIRRGLIAFDLSAIPAGATITSVQLRLKIGQIAGSGGGSGGDGPPPATIDLHKMSVSWGEANTGASTATGLGGIGQGSPAQNGDATWNARFFDPVAPTAWTDGVGGGKPGVDYVDTASASLLQSNTPGAVSLWLSTPQLVADVQNWLAAPATNNGWMLINQNEVDSQTFRGFYSRNYNPNPAPPDLVSYFPQLIVDFELPRLPGDVNNDRTVDFVDLGILLNYYLQPGTIDEGDFNHSGTVEFDDLGILLNHYDQPVPAATPAFNAPEFSTLATALFGTAWLICAACCKRNCWNQNRLQRL